VLTGVEPPPLVAPVFFDLKVLGRQGWGAVTAPDAVGEVAFWAGVGGGGGASKSDATAAAGTWVWGLGHGQPSVAGIIVFVVLPLVKQKWGTFCLLSRLVTRGIRARSGQGRGPAISSY